MQHDAQASKRGLWAVEIVIFRIAAIYPGHATLDLFGVRVHAGTLDAHYRALVSGP